MQIPDFEEKQYEWALLLELAAGTPNAYPSGQVLESLVGFDLALRPGDAKIWTLLGAGFPQGVALTSGMWQGAPKQPPQSKLPTGLVSLILQVKRPQWLDHWRAGQHHFWGGGYFRFYVSPSQQDQLLALEANTGGKALVRYAAPAFLSLSALYTNQTKKSVADRSTFVAPDVLVGHRLWSYAGPGTFGYPNPDGPEARADTWATLLERAEEQSSQESLDQHVIALAEGAGLDLPASEWVDLIAEENDLPLARRQALQAWAAFAGAVAAAQAEWLVLDFDRSPSGSAAIN